MVRNVAGLLLTLASLLLFMVGIAALTVIAVAWAAG